MLRVRRIACLQQFASVHANVHNHFNSQRLIDRTPYNALRSAALGRSTRYCGRVLDASAPSLLTAELEAELRERLDRVITGTEAVFPLPITAPWVQS